MKRLLLTLTIAIVTLAGAVVQGAQVTWGAAQSNGIGTSNGTPLAVGSLVRVGWFNFSTDVAMNNAMILANMNNPSILNSHFIEFGNSMIGAGNPNGPNPSDNRGYWLDTDINSTLALGIENQQIYYWLFNTPTFNAATEYGVFTSGVVAWKFPADAAIPNTTTTDLADVPHNASGIIIGSFGNGTSLDGASPLFNLAPIPEPSTTALMVLGFAGAVYARRKRRTA